jgi:hypothetical protein
VRKLFLALALLGVLAIPAAAAATVAPPVMCGPTCDTGGGFTGCKSIEVSRSSQVWGVYTINHVLRANYCKRYGVITSVSVYNYCDSGGLISCDASIWFPTGGGVGYTWATFEGHAKWHVTTLPIYNGTDILDLLIPSADG